MSKTNTETAATLFLLLGFIALALGVSSFAASCPKFDIYACFSQIALIVGGIVAVFISVNKLS